MNKMIAKRIGFIEAMTYELDELVKRFTKEQTKVEEIYGKKFYIVQYSNLELIITLSGVGKVNSALTTTVMIMKYDPDIIINVGVAGGFKEGQKLLDLFIAEEFIYTDVDATNFGFLPGQVPYDQPRYNNVSKELIQMIKELESESKIPTKVHYGLLGSSDSFIRTDEQVQKIKELFSDVACVEMEGTSIAQICTKFNKPVLSIRSFSDIAIEKKDNTVDFENLLEVATKTSTDLCMALLDKISSQQ
ncbi:5'-methylthioadenosine nucleosidase [Histomonas meleagridis]|uniref:5'-methylthioadenosine nucleosidase n=1 Tax=Histomonas meleagridis TaxID=135588 RepID=UPI00355A6264|nr:5'-methylthioadenosine nucleosidase [Histomonas meleagridis]KAH0804682.1 5'-methylthioadenosine nucleosidase [Histomonas meleagridis]